VSVLLETTSPPRCPPRWTTPRSLERRTLGPRVAQVAAPLGLGTQADESQGQLRPGQRLICYTDGLVEARNAAGEFLDRACFEEVAAGGTLPEALDHLVELVGRHAEGRHDDDLALLGLEYAPTG